MKAVTYLADGYGGVLMRWETPKHNRKVIQYHKFRHPQSCMAHDPVSEGLLVA